MARRLLFLISDLEHTGAAHQLALLARSLPRNDFDVRTCCLGEEGPVGRALLAAGVAVESLGWRRLFDVVAVRQLRNVLRSGQNELVHIFGLAALRWACVTGADQWTCLVS